MAATKGCHRIPEHESMCRPGSLSGEEDLATAALPCGERNDARRWDTQSRKSLLSAAAGRPQGGGLSRSLDAVGIGRQRELRRLCQRLMRHLCEQLSVRV